MVLGHWSADAERRPQGGRAEPGLEETGLLAAPEAWNQRSKGQTDSRVPRLSLEETRRPRSAGQPNAARRGG